MTVFDEPTPPAAMPVKNRALRAQRVLRQWSIAAGCGFLVGFLIIGVGIRTAMRVSAFLAGPEFQGTLTDAEEVVGEITLDGTFGLVLFSAVIGVAGAVFYLLVRPWVPGRGAVHGLAIGGVGLALLGGFLFDPDNFDFRTFGPVWVNVPMYASLAFAYGIVLDRTVRFFDRVLPEPPGSRLQLGAAAVPVALSLLPTAFMVVGPAVVLGSVHPLLLLLSPLYWILLVGTRAATDGGLGGVWRERVRVWHVGRALLAVPVLAGGAFVVRNIVLILMG